MKIWVTQYALTKGILVIEDAEILSSGTAKWQGRSLCSIREYARAGDWHDTEKAAQEDAESRRVKKLASLKKKIAELEALTFKVSS